MDTKSKKKTSDKKSGLINPLIEKIQYTNIKIPKKKDGAFLVYLNKEIEKKERSLGILDTSSIRTKPSDSVLPKRDSFSRRSLTSAPTPPPTRTSSPQKKPKLLKQ